MRVKLLTIFPTPRKTYKAGREVDLTDSDAIRMIERGLAEPVRTEVIETTTPARGEQTVRRAGAERRGRAHR